MGSPDPWWCVTHSQGIRKIILGTYDFHDVESHHKNGIYCITFNVMEFGKSWMNKSKAVHEIDYMDLSVNIKAKKDCYLNLSLRVLHVSECMNVAVSSTTHTEVCFLHLASHYIRTWTQTLSLELLWESLHQHLYITHTHTHTHRETQRSSQQPVKIKVQFNSNFDRNKLLLYSRMYFSK